MQVELRGHESDPAATWALVGDTNHLSDLADNPRIAMQMVPDAAGYPEIVGHMVGPGPLKQNYTEVDSRWVSGRWFDQERHIAGPLMKRTHYQARIEPGKGKGVVPVVQLTVDFQNPVFGVAGGVAMKAAMKKWQSALNALPRPGEAPPPATQRALPGAVQSAIERWRRRDVDPALVDRLSQWMQQTRALNLSQIRPFVLAERWGVDRREMVTAMMAGTEAGALELYWATRCPRCGGPLNQAQTLSDLADHADCPSCRIGIDAELDRNVEVLFAAHAAIRPPPEARFCTMYPAARPEVLALATVRPGQPEEFEVDLPPGTWSLGGGGGEPDVTIVASESGSDELRWARGGPSERLQAKAGRVQLRLENPTEGRVRVQLSGDPDGGRWLSAAWLTTMPEYRRSYGAQALATDVRLGVKAVAILFTDLTGSAAMYHEHGDATAFKLVHEHFAVLDKVLDEYNGAKVKTIGDALMASFLDPAAALAAALAMQTDFQTWAAGLDMAAPPGLKVGLHFGPAMAVHSDQAGLDYFGGTVNMAARCEGQCARGDVVWTDSVHQSPGVAERLAAWGGTVAPYEGTVKGIPEPVPLYRAHVGPQPS